LGTDCHKSPTASQVEGGKTVSEIHIRKLAEVRTATLGVKGVFIAIGLRANTSLIAHVVDLNGQEEVVIEADCLPRRPGPACLAGQGGCTRAAFFVVAAFPCASSHRVRTG